MEVDIQDVVLNIKRKYVHIRADHLKQRLWHLKNVANLELVEEEGDIKKLILEQDQAVRHIGDHQVGITYAHLFKRGHNLVKQDIRLLALGEAGIGKTTLCTSIAQDWANGKLFQEFFIVLLLPLCQRNIASVKSLPELLDQLGLFDRDTANESCSALINYLATHENRILIIADEWDECHSTDSFLFQLLFGNLLGNTSITVVITARPDSFPPHMAQHIDQLIIVRGFSKATVDECVQSEFSGDIEKIRYVLGQLRDNMLIDSMSRVPLNLALICNLCQTQLFTKPLPNTMTKLYKMIVWNNAEINIRACDNYKSLMSLSGYHDLPKELQQSWWIICEVAFRNVNKRSALFSQQQLEAAYTTALLAELETVSCFGFLKSRSVPRIGDKVYFCFLHPVIEEYLAVLHLIRQKKAEQLHFIELCNKHVHVCYRHFSHFWRFYFGVLANKNLCNDVNIDIIAQAVQMLSQLHRSGNNEYLLCYYSLEANNRLVNQEIVRALSKIDSEQSGSVSVNFVNPRNSQDCNAMIHVIENVDIECSMEICFENCDLKAEKILRLANALSSVSSRESEITVQVKGLDLSGNELDDSVMVDFFHQSAAALSSLRKLFLRNCRIGTKTIHAFTKMLAKSSSQSLVQLDLSFNLLSMLSLDTLKCHIESHNSLAKLEIFFLKGSVSLTKDVDIDIFVDFIDTLAARCLHLRRLDLSANNLGKPGNPKLSNIISKLTSLRRDFDLCLNPEYMFEVENNFVSVMEESIRNKGTINHTIAHGIIVGPGRSGKNTLMNRLMGIKPDPDSISPSTGVLETVVKVEVKKLCTVATAVSGLKWQKLEYDEEALELIMMTIRDHSASHSELESIKYIVKEQSIQGTITNDLVLDPSAEITNSSELQTEVAKPFAKLIPKQSSKTEIKRNFEEIDASLKNVVVYSSDLEPVDIFKRAVKLRRMDALREHLELSWSLYLTNTGGQTEFQEHLSLLACGPSIFFVTFPLHHDLEQPYQVQYEDSDGQVKAYQPYQSTATLLEELLQTLATIDALSYASEQSCSAEPIIKPKVFFIGTHSDKLPEMTAEETIKQKDKLLQKFVRQTSVFNQGSIQFAQAQPTPVLIFAVNNLSTDDNVFQAIRSAVQQTIERKCSEDFTVKCPSSWLVFSLILRAKHKSNQVLSFEQCFSIAQECGISDRRELSQALSFIHLRLGLVRYFNVEGLNELVIIDPQVLFDRITVLLKKTFTPSHAEVNQIENFYQKGILPVAVVESINKKCDSDAQIPFPWLTKLLNYLRIAALFRDQDGEKYFFPAALCHAPKPHSNQCPSSPPLLVGFESGFCPRGVPGALIKILMTNEMKSKFPWKLRPKKIFRNQVSFSIEAYSDITLKFFPTHLEIFLDSEDDITEDELYKTCTEACTQITESMKIVSSHFSVCPHFLSFYCTLDECQTHPHPAKIEWRGSTPYKLKCNIIDKRGRLPTDYIRYFSGDLDKEIDFCHSGVPKHLGRLADLMAEWEGRIAEELGLSAADVASIKMKYPSDIKLQSYV